MISQSNDNVTINNANNHLAINNVIGLDVGGTLFYCRVSTLISGGTSTYFQARFGSNSTLDPEIDRVDNNGKLIFFIDRDPQLFKYILDYMRTSKLPSTLRSFQENSGLWRALREEATFFALDALSLLLKVTYTCSPEKDGGKGILYWLGTNKGKEDYENPYKRQSVNITGWIDDLNEFDYEEAHHVYGHCYREGLVQYRPRLKVEEMQSNINKSLNMCRFSSQQNSIEIIFRDITICPTYYSLRWGGCKGMQGDWHFEGSGDNRNWTILHRGRDVDGHNVSFQKFVQREDRSERAMLTDHIQNNNDFDDEEKVDIWTHYMEKEMRRVWEVEDHTDNYYKYFRIIGIDTGEGFCLHYIGLEIFGKVHEC